MKKKSVTGICLVLVLGGFESTAAQVLERGKIIVNIESVDSGDGIVVAHLFRKGDKLFGDNKLVAIGRLSDHTASIIFENIPFGEYAILVFQDRNQNGILDHNLLHIPAEPLGLSNNFKPTIFTGPPEFSDIGFQFKKNLSMKLTLGSF